MKIALVGTFHGTHVGASFERAARALGHSVVAIDGSLAYAGNAFLRAFCWRFLGHRPPRLQAFACSVVETCRAEGVEILVATGLAPLTREALADLRAMGVVTVDYLTDDPFNPAMTGGWITEALPAYDLIFNPRQANLDELRTLGCREVRYLPFAYDDALFGKVTEGGTEGFAPEVLFVGGADNDRAAFIGDLVARGVNVTLVGGYWDRYPALLPLSLGHRSPDELRALTGTAKVNLCLVRRGNRDGHVMRSFEIPASGGCMLAEDTAEHRDIFGPDGEAVLYFRTPADAAVRIGELLGDDKARRRLSGAARARIVSGRHTYRHRLEEMLAMAGSKSVDGTR